MSPGGTASAGLAFAQATSEPFFPLAGAVLLLVLLVGAAVLIAGSRSRRGTAWRPPWAVRDGGAAGDAAVPAHLSSLRLDAAHRLHVIAWDDRQFLVVTGLQGAPAVIASRGVAPAVGSAAPEHR